MIEPHCGAIRVFPWIAPLKKHSTARMMQLAVVHRHEAGITSEIRPHVVVARSVTELIHDEVVGPLSIFP